ncbi:glycine oxidase ThiO [Peribacillus alkalitolerans]|uniref:glycine oxidase ThiO n=1 Tax=Peribacillus alkalitolerans TaxID=1550385 RepID=UPI0013D0FB2A|nr:glycine oxidase ThiO [Peribacillus alkalitolerans]
MKQYYDVIIVGGGVIGSSIAYQLAKRKKKVLLIEENQISSKASKAAAGMLGVHTELHNNEHLFSLAKESRDMLPILSEELKDICGIDIELIQNGMIKLAQTEGEKDKLKEMSLQSDQVEWLSPSQLSNFEPNLSHSSYGGLHLPKDGNVSAPNLTKAFAVSAQRLGAEIKEYTSVYDFIRESKRIIGIKTLTESYFADEVIVAGGAWSQQLLKQVDIEVKSYPVKGECFSVYDSENLIKRTIFTNGCYIVPKAGGRLLIGATEHLHTFDESVSLKGISGLMTRAISLVPRLANAKLDRAWAGIRPRTQSGLPLMGRCADWEGLSIATGHYRNGILLAPITGVIMADLVEGKESHLLLALNTLKTRSEIRGVTN